LQRMLSKKGPVPFSHLAIACSARALDRPSGLDAYIAH
jgi:hypothetical protein